MPIFALSVSGAKPTLLPNQVMPLTIGVKEYDGSAGTPAEGFNVQVAVDVWPLANLPSVFSQNAIFNNRTQKWEINIPRPQNSGNYRLQVHAYCARDDSICAVRYGKSRQLEWEYYFSATDDSHPQTLTFRVKLAGVTDDSADGLAKIAVKFYLSDGSVRQLSGPLTLYHIGNGIYWNKAILSNPFQAGTKFIVQIKGDKHTAIRFTHLSGQTNQCQDEAYITVPAIVPSSFDFDFTGVPLPAGDTYPQDGQVNQTDIGRIVALMSKSTESLTDADKLTGDMNYDGRIFGNDLLLLYKTLQTRCD